MPMHRDTDVVQRKRQLGKTRGKATDLALPFVEIESPLRCGRRGAPRMKLHASVTSAFPLRARNRLEPTTRDLDSRPGGVRLIAALLLLAIPLVVAAWGLGNYAAQRERNDADNRLAEILSSGAAGGAFHRAVFDTAAAANHLAHHRRVQLHFLRGKSKTLVWKATPLGRVTHWFAAVPEAAVVRRVNVVSKHRTVGQVVVFLPLDSALVRRLTQVAHVDSRQRLALATGGSLVGPAGTQRIDSGAQTLGPSPSDVRAGGLGYRAVSADLGRSAGHTKLVALESSSYIGSKANSAEWRVIGLGLGLIAALLALAYAVSPSIARTRVSKEERERSERVLAHVGDGVFLVDRDGVIRLWNPAAQAITGLRSDAICNRPAEATIPGWDAIAARVPVARRPGDVDDASSAETVPLEVDGREVWLSIVGVALADGIVYAFRDVTRERRLEELRSQFVATISHELRTPLASLHGAAMTLLEREHDLSGQTQHDLLDMIAVQSKRLANLVEEILLAGQLDSGSLRVVTEPFDPEELVWTAAAAARLRVGDDTTIDVSIPAVLPKVTGDPERTRQVLTNLVDNAIKYSPAGGRIEVGLEVDGGHARFTVRDEGLGIPLGEQKRIFEKFYRLDPDHRRGVGGSGLGLYICRELVRSMNGRIWVESDPGKGATFTFELPIADRVTATA
jgi:two-component system phosphate regulon sensor histidine kinase PhoR